MLGIGPAGTGKTFLAMAMGVALLSQKRVSRIILTRPAVEAGERDLILLGDSAGVIAQASGKARARGPAECQARLAEFAASLDRLRFRHIKSGRPLLTLIQLENDNLSVRHAITH